MGGACGLASLCMQARARACAAPRLGPRKQAGLMCLVVLGRGDDRPCGPQQGLPLGLDRLSRLSSDRASLGPGLRVCWATESAAQPGGHHRRCPQREARSRGRSRPRRFPRFATTSAPRSRFLPGSFLDAHPPHPVPAIFRRRRVFALLPYSHTFTPCHRRRCCHRRRHRRRRLPLPAPRGSRAAAPSARAPPLRRSPAPAWRP